MSARFRKAGAFVNASDLDQGKSTALMLAANNGHVTCLQFLIKAGADVNMIDIRGDTALNRMAAKGDVLCMNLLIEAGADVNSVNLNGSTPIWKAARSGNDKNVEFLIKRGADVNRARTTLGAAARSSSKRCIQLLLKAGIHVNNVNKMGNNALTIYIKKTGRKDSTLVLLLLAAGEFLNNFTQNYANMLGKAGLPEYLCDQRNPPYLKHLAREIIRKIFLNLTSVNLFIRIHHLDLPSSLISYLLFDVSLDDNIS